MAWQKARRISRVYGVPVNPCSVFFSSSVCLDVLKYCLYGFKKLKWCCWQMLKRWKRSQWADSPVGAFTLNMLGTRYCRSCRFAESLPPPSLRYNTSCVQTVLKTTQTASKYLDFYNKIYAVILNKGLQVWMWWYLILVFPVAHADMMGRARNILMWILFTLSLF